jgi:hypothetical protein
MNTETRMGKDKIGPLTDTEVRKAKVQKKA